MTPIITAIPFFPEHELACKGTGVIKLDPRFAEELPKLREAWGLTQSLETPVSWNSNAA